MLRFEYDPFLPAEVRLKAILLPYRQVLTTYASGEGSGSSGSLLGGIPKL
jgi:hypothetical protein